MTPRACAIVLAVAAPALACTSEPVRERPIAGLDPAAYATLVHPVVRVSCASLDCHGQPGRPLRLYSEDGLRATDSLRGAPITDDELAWNVAAFAGVDPEAPSPELDLVLSKPVAGEVSHAGGDVWPTREDPGYVCVRAWLAGESERAASVAACLEARAQVDPYPPDGG